MAQPANLILFQSDNHNGRITGCYGHPYVKTPVMKAAEALGLLGETQILFTPPPGVSKEEAWAVPGKH